MKKVRLALLDLNNNHPNQGMRNIREISQAFKEHAEEHIEITNFDVRYKNEIPRVADFDIFISSGGPGTPHPEGHPWEKKYYNFLDRIWEYNLNSPNRKFLFLICHSYQVASIHWKIGKITKRKSFSFGVMPMHKTEAGKTEYLFRTLNDPFYAVDSRAYQFVEPDEQRMAELGMKIVAIEKYRPYVPLERAVMAIRFSNEIFGTQFHPEAEPIGFMKNLEQDKNRNALIGDHGMRKYLETIERLHDPSKIMWTQSQVLPRFLEYATKKVMEAEFSYF